MQRRLPAFLTLSFMLVMTSILVLPGHAASARSVVSIDGTSQPHEAQVVVNDWCVAGGFQGWDNASDRLYDDGTHGDLVQGDGIFSLEYTIANPGRYEWKAVECGNWSRAFPAQNSWFFTETDNQTVVFTFDANNHTDDAGKIQVPLQDIVSLRGDDLPGSFNAVGDFEVPNWTNNDPATDLTFVGNGYYRLEYIVPNAGTYEAKIVRSGSWSEQFGADGRSVEAGVINFATSQANQAVIFLLDARDGRVTIVPNGAGTEEWCLAGSFNNWDNSSTPLYDDGTNGDLLGGDGVYSLDLALADAGGYEWKAVECGNWDRAFPPQNAWVITDSANETVKFTFDTNDHTGDAGAPLLPMQYIVNAWDDLPASFNAVGTFEDPDWDNSDPATELTDRGEGWHTLTYSVPLSGDYVGKITESGGWFAQFGANGRSIDATPIGFQVTSERNKALFVLDGYQGRMNIILGPSGAAGHDGIVLADALAHDSRDRAFRVPQGAVTTGTEVMLRLRAAKNDLTAARVRVWDDRQDRQLVLPMTLAATDEEFEWWEATIPASDIPTIFWYRFIAMDGDAVAYYEDDPERRGGLGQAYQQSPDNGWGIAVYDPDFQTPDWVKNAVIYQLFPDRFRDANAANNVPPGTFFYDESGGTIFRSGQDDWNYPICDPRLQDDCPDTYSRNFYGGDLQGVLDKLDYLKELGITAIYFNPIFESPSNHKYDTTDFSLIDDNLAIRNNHRASERLFKALAQAAHAKGINIILDGVFNHTSSDSIYFDRYGRYESLGACESLDSPYRDWFFFTDVAPGTGSCVGSDGAANGAEYESWFGFDSLPKLDSSNEEVRDLIWDRGPNSIARLWVDPADGWRLDVAADVDAGWTNQPDNYYWEGFRDAVRATDPEGYIVGEEWNFATPWTLGEEWDATMNYQFSTALLGFWRDDLLIDNDHNAASSAGQLEPLTPSELNERLLHLQERYPPEAFYAMMNLLGSHDTNRPLFLLDENADQYDPSLYNSPSYDWSDAIQRLKGTALLQLTLPGAPTIYYGDEVGLVGPVNFDGSTWQDDPYNRQPFPWLDETGTPFYPHMQEGGVGWTELLPYYQTLTAARNNHPALRTGSFDPLLVDDASNVYVYGRKMADNSDAALVFINRSDAGPQRITVDLTGYLPFGATFVNVLDNNTSHTIGNDGQLTIEVPARGGALLVATEPLTAPPAVVSDLAVAAEHSQTIELAWSAVPGADSYDVYRSLLSGGGYEFVANTTEAGYTDTGLTNATQYFYVVVSRDAETGLASEFSNQASGIPHYDLTAPNVWYNLQWPPEITHVISTINPTENIYGQIYIPDATGASGPASGIRAQVGFGPDGSTPDESWTWEEMRFAGAVGNNDEYVGNLLPDTTGEFDYLTRWSSDGGRTWFLSDLDGPGLDGERGVLHVVASDDTTAPAAPENLTLTGSSPGSISMRWDAVDVPDLAGYEIYRRPAGEAGAFARIARVGPEVTSFDDVAVETGETYEYFVLAFDTSWNRSARSNTIQGTAELRTVQVTWRVTVPDWTTIGAPGYLTFIAGDNAQVFGATWNPGAQPMTQVQPNVWEFTVEVPDGQQLEYKYTRGQWEKVEWWGDITGLANRRVTIQYGADGTQLIEDEVINWRDLLVVEYGPQSPTQPIDEISATFNRLVQPDTVDFGEDFHVTTVDGTAIAGTWRMETVPNPVSGDTAATQATRFIFTPASPLDPTSSYRVTIEPRMFGIGNDGVGLRQTIVLVIGG